MSEAKKKLEAYGRVYEKIEVLENQKQKLMDAATNITVDPTAEVVESSGDKDRLGKLAAAISDKQAEIDRYIIEAWQTICEISEIINAIENNDSARVLLMRYVERLKPADIEKRMNISMAKYYRDQQSGLAEADKYLESTKDDSI